MGSQQVIIGYNSILSHVRMGLLLNYSAILFLLISLLFKSTFSWEVTATFKMYKKSRLHGCHPFYENESLLSCQMRCVASVTKKCTSFNYYPSERRCCLAGGSVGYGANFPNPHPETGHITFAGTLTVQGNV